MLKIRTTLSLLLLALSSLQMLNGMAPDKFDRTPENQRSWLAFFIQQEDIIDCVPRNKYKILQVRAISNAFLGARLNLVYRPGDLDTEAAKFTSLHRSFDIAIVRQILNEQKDIDRETVTKAYAWRSEEQKAWASAVARACIKK